MKPYTVLILDDEEWIVRGLVEMLDWEKQGFLVAGQYTDPEAALQKIRETEPDLLLLDIHMPKISGDVMMEMIREEGIPTEFILLSGYSDFSVAQKAINHGAHGYLLKPLKKPELISALQRVKKTFEERNSSEIGIPIDPMNYDAFFQHAWQGRESLAERGGYYQLILADSDLPAGFPPSEHTVFSKPVHIYGGRTLRMAVSPSRKEPCDLETVKQWSRENGISTGLSRPGASLKEYHNMFRQANCALCCAHLQNRTDCYLYTPPNMSEVYRWMQTLQKLYEEKDSEKIYWELSRLADEWKFQGNPASVLMLISQLTYTVVPGKELERKNRELNLEKFLYDDISSKFSNIAEIFDYLIQLLSTEEAEQEELIQIPKTVSDLKQYLYRHYDEELNLTRISREFFLTPAYLCEIFKKFTGCTITGYLLKIRMEKASALLLDTEASLVDIAAQVGYNDYNYFCRLFKRYFNTSPTAYRKGKK